MTKSFHLRARGKPKRPRFAHGSISAGTDKSLTCKRRFLFLPTKRKWAQTIGETETDLVEIKVEKSGKWNRDERGSLIRDIAKK